jgi:hypothetical protein
MDRSFAFRSSTITELISQNLQNHQILRIIFVVMQQRLWKEIKEVYIAGYGSTDSVSRHIEKRALEAIHTKAGPPSSPNGRGFEHRKKPF